MGISIHDIESMTEQEVRENALEHMVIKDHDIYFVDFGGNFGYSYLVFYDGANIKYAADYQLHHSTMTQMELRKAYINGIKKKLFTDAEILRGVKTYDDLESKRYYLRNYYGFRKPHVTIFRINPTDAEQAEFERKTADMIYDPISFAFYDDREFVKRHVELYNKLEESLKKLDEDFEYWKSAFKYEMWNHEFIYDDYQANWDVLSCFGNPTYRDDDDPNAYMEELGFNRTKKHAYMMAAVEYLKEVEAYM